jgi:GR25 family glycosyltransferase involved in LPS biosynthesis
VEVAYLNLATRPDRDERFRRINGGIADYRRVNAIVGDTLRADDLIRAGVIAEPLTSFTHGALGNAVSHKRFWEQCAAGTTPLTVAEDDAALNRRFAQKAPAVLSRLPTDWDIVLWGWNFDSVLRVGILGGVKEAAMNFDPRPLGASVSEFQAHDEDVQPLRLINVFGLAAYTISPTGARRLLAACFPLTNEPIVIAGMDHLLANISLDATMNRHYRALQAYVCFPPLAWTENDKAASDVVRTPAGSDQFRGPTMQQPEWLLLALQADQLLTQDRIDEAVSHAQRSLQINADCAVARGVLGMVHWRHGRPREGIEEFRRALAVRPDLAAAHNGLGLCLAQVGDHDSAQREYELSLIFQPGYPHARFNRAMQLLRRGRYEDGWVEYEWRWASGQLTWPEIPRPKWDGSPLNGRSLLVHTEQGVGDVLMFLRFLPRVKTGPSDRLVFACQKALQSLLRNVPYVDDWFPIDQPAAINFDVYIPMLSLPGVLNLGTADIPYPVPYVMPDPALVEKWRPRIAELHGRKIGICWQGSPTFKGDQFRSIPLAQFAPLAQVPEVTLVSLQKGAGEEQIVANRTAVPLTAFPDLDVSAPFADTAAIMQHLDLVITSDTAIAHLAGALGRPVWVALGMDCDWRWGIGRLDSPWYPTMRLFRQSAANDWAGVFSEMAAALRRGETVVPCRQASPIDLTCPVSAGELVDKITILEIKAERIAEADKLANVLRELDELRAVQPRTLSVSTELTTLAADLKKVNEQLWQIEDDIRKCEKAGDFGDRFVALARSVYQSNDVRAALKRRINDLLGSRLVEEKSYAG